MTLLVNDSLQSLLAEPEGKEEAGSGGRSEPR